jgi:hypothetical protein
MHTISSLRKALGLSTMNQVRNRIEVVKDLLSEHLRRGPNNQILVNEAGVDLLRQLQELYDGGLTMAEASSVLRAKTYQAVGRDPLARPGVAQDRMKPDQDENVVVLLKDELAFLRQRIVYLEERLRETPGSLPPGNGQAWWERLKGEVDAT